MCAGYYKMLVGLRSEGKTVVPNPQFDNEPVRYEHRYGILRYGNINLQYFVLDLEPLPHFSPHP